MNNPDVKNFLLTIEQAAVAKTDLSIRAQRAVLCPPLDHVRELIKRVVPLEQRVVFTGSFTGKETMCIAGNMLLTFTFDDVAVMSSRTPGRPLIDENLCIQDKKNLVHIGNDFHDAGRTWSGYEESVENFYLGLSQGQSYFYKNPNDFGHEDTVVGLSDVDRFNIRIRPGMGGYGGEESFMRHINLNAQFFKRFLELGLPFFDRGGAEGGRGIVSAKPITIHMFQECDGRTLAEPDTNPDPMLRVARGDKVLDREHFLITRKGMVCTDVRGVPFVLVGHRRYGSARRRSRISTIDLAMPFGHRLNKRKRES